MSSHMVVLPYFVKLRPQRIALALGVPQPRHAGAQLNQLHLGRIFLAGSSPLGRLYESSYPDR